MRALGFFHSNFLSANDKFYREASTSTCEMKSILDVQEYELNLYIKKKLEGMYNKNAQQIFGYILRFFKNLFPSL